MGEVRIRRAEDEDLLALATIFARAVTDLIERHQPASRGLLPIDPAARAPALVHLLATGGMFVAQDDEPIGFASALVRDGVWFLSQLWVVPERQGEGIGKTLIDEALAWGRGCSAFTVISSVHPGAQTLYLRRSMFPAWVQLDLEGDLPPGSPPSGLRDLDEEDQPWLDRLDVAARGIARPEDHAHWREEMRGLALRREGRDVGYVYVSPHGGPGDAARVGPAAAVEPKDVPVLLDAARSVVHGRAAFDVPSTNWPAIARLVRFGFRWGGSATFMASRAWPDGATYLSSGGRLG